ncbi:PREDICTED: tetratricopeptide repeat protein 28-like [Branchiostoma belcheri]|uniref:Tetratricopeptide repeat protein 28-like n=1 Tax=Branchiostoma belcheri TaxID=7741 RepID=A0A6P5A9N9_BRABE|nr:PREDICTED: tetratricopeptide repeat protein 28-like [Branchiostoma belcheri]
MLALARDLGRKDNERLAYNRLGVACRDMQGYVAALEWNKKTLKMSNESGDKTEQMTANNNIAGSYKALGKLELARSHYQSAMTIAMETGNKTRQMDIHLELGDLHREQLHEPQESHKYYTEMLALARDLGRKDKERLAYNRLGLACRDMQDYEAALEWDKNFLKMCNESGDKTVQISAHKNIAVSYKALGKLDLVRSHYQSAMTIAMETGNKTEQMDIYCQLGDLHREQLHEPQESHKYYTEMLAIARDLGRKGKERQAYNRLGLACGDMQDYEAALEWHQKNLKMSQECGDKTGQITVHQNIAGFYRALGKLDLANSHYQSAMTIAMETGNKTEQMDIYLELGDLHREQLHEPQESHKYYTEMLALARDLGRKEDERQAYKRVGAACWDMQDYEAALEWSQKDLKMSQEIADKTGKMTAHQNIADSYRALGKLDLARSHYQSAMTITMEMGNKTRQMDINLKLGDLHREQLHEPQESHKYYTEMLALARDLGRKNGERLAYNRLGLASDDMQDYELALEWFQKDLKMSQESGDKTVQITVHQNIAVTYKTLGKLDLARSHFQSAMTIAKETGNKQKQEDIAKKLANL